MLETNSSLPIYMQIAHWIENKILAGMLQVDDKVYSQYQLAEMFNVNPATAGKGIALLLEKEIVYKKRGLGTFVSADGFEKLLEERKKHRLHQKIQALLEEAARLQITYEELLQLIDEVYRQEGGNEDDGYPL